MAEFDWLGLWLGAFAASANVDRRKPGNVQDGADYLRDRVSEAFLPAEEWHVLHAAYVDMGNLCSDALTRAEAAEARVNALEDAKRAMKLQAGAVRTLQANEQTEINCLRRKQTEAYHAIATLDSERQMNAALTEENEALRAKLAEAEGVIGEIIEYCTNPGHGNPNKDEWIVGRCQESVMIYAGKHMEAGDAD